MPKLKKKSVETKKKGQSKTQAKSRRRSSSLSSPSAHAASQKRSRASVDYVEPVRELLMLRIVTEIEKRQWTQVQAAKFFGVSQPRISDLNRGLTSNFTIDVLVHFIGLLGMDLKIDTESSGAAQNVYAWLDDSEQAIPYYTKLIASNPAYAENYWKRAYAYHQRGQYDLAVGDFTRAMELDASLQYLRINRAQSYICLGQYSSAFFDCDQLISQSPEPTLAAWAFITKASAHQALGHDDSALAEYKHAIKRAPEFPSAYFHRGQLHAWKKNYKAALKDFSKVLQLEPNNTAAQKHKENIRKLSGEQADDE